MTYRRRRPPTSPLLVLLVPVAALLASCAPAGEEKSAPAATVTVTATVTASPPAAEAPDTGSIDVDAPISAAQAWLLCYGATSGMYADSSKIFPYTDGSALGKDTVTRKADGSFEVLVTFAPISGAGYGAESICEASGTVGRPVVELRGGRDFG